MLELEELMEPWILLHQKVDCCETDLTDCAEILAEYFLQKKLTVQPKFWIVDVLVWKV